MQVNLLHPAEVARALYFAQRRRLKRFLCIPDKARSPVLDSGLNQAVERYRRICQTLLAYLPADLPPHFVAAEIGCGDCLAAADMMLGLGARHIRLVEQQAMPITPLHAQALQRLVCPGLPNQALILSSGQPHQLNPTFSTLHTGLMENIHLPEPVDLLYSFDVLEHVEDLTGFFASCHRFLKPGGYALHKFDLTGHEFLEDPIPPLDFQAYPCWLYRLMFPRYRRAVRHFADQFIEAMKNSGFEILRITPLRQAEPHYLSQIRPRLRPEARARSDEVLSLLDLVVLARRPINSP